MNFYAQKIYYFLIFTSYFFNWNQQFYNITYYTPSLESFTITSIQNLENSSYSNLFYLFVNFQFSITWSNRELKIISMIHEGK